MEQNFQTSFMPKKPMIDERVSTAPPVGVLAILSMFIFFTMLLSTGGLFFYRGVVRAKISSMENDLNAAKGRFEPAKILQLQVLDKRLRASSEVLTKHIALTPVFKILEGVTMKTVRYTKFTYSLGEEKNSKINFKLNGQAVGYRSVALQSELFTKNKQIIDPVFSNLALDDKGNVLFELNFSVDPSFVDYTKMIKTESDTTSPIINSVLPTETPVLPSNPSPTLEVVPTNTN